MNQSADTPSGTPAEGPAASGPVARQGRGKEIALRVLQVVVGLFYALGSAVPKLIGQQMAVDTFQDIGAGMWLMYLVGVLELAGGIGLITPWLSGLAALGLIALMIGAFITQLTVFHGDSAAFPLVMIVPLAVIAWGRRSTLKALPTLLHGKPGARPAP
ncbi:DoxX family protein [Streptomyces sp. HNM0575]|uniref:DoxX family protein n=1 Tax=Streptomyces sp. HNM0575 TaxID=2716338 RepID=UPI00145EEF9C|nr:DoxX family protein [Streptomyces sp. HNM0575]NLU76628.1 DoxX family protein [Streptomyces sp. HNM0575]